MRRYAIDAYVVDVLMADLVGHDRTPAAFIVYLCLACAAERKGSATVAISLQEIAVRTGLAKSTVQAAIRHLKKRGLLDANVDATSDAPVRRIARPWIERRRTTA
jgi:DNA-binding MarR family transcriptional regulator